MKTLKEVITVLDGCFLKSRKEWCIENCPYLQNDEQMCRRDVLTGALHYLKEYQAILPLVPYQYCNRSAEDSTRKDNRMKTLDEVIKAMETDPVPMAYTARLSVHEDIMTDALEWLKAYKGHIELDKLRDKCEAKNDPLTWDELKQMEGKPVWIELQKGIWKGWDVVGGFDEDDFGVAMVTVRCDDYYKADLGKT